MNFSYKILFSFLLVLVFINSAVAQDEDFGCGAVSLQSLVASYQLALLDEGMDDDPDGDIPEDAAIDPNYTKLGKALQSLHKLGMLGADVSKMPEVILGASAENFSDWQALFGDKSISVDDNLVSIADSDLQDLLDNSNQCREVLDICKSIAAIKVKKVKKSNLKLLNSFLKVGLIKAIEATEEIDAADLKAPKAACLKAEKKIKLLLK